MTGVMPRSQGRRATGRPVPWRRLGWVAWRQHRAGLAGAGAVFAVLCLVMLAEGLTARANHLGHVTCHVAGGCYEPTYSGTGGTTALALQVVPGLVGAFLGAPLLARELETGTYRFVWTQECGRGRWLVAKLLPVAFFVTVGSALLSLVTWWYLQPFVDAGLISGIRSPEFNVRGVDFAAWTLVAFAIAVLAGVLVRRVIPAMFVALCAWVGLFFLTIGVIRPRYAAPLVGKTGAITVGWWVVGQSHGAATVLYQPESRFWLFQLIEGGWLFVLAALMFAGSVWYVRRRIA